jgi:dihydrofolate reductase
MRVTLFMAFSVNGYIASEDGSEDFLSHANWNEFVRLAERSGCFIVGRRTYEIVKKLYPASYNFDTVNARRIVVSSKPAPKSAKGYIFVRSPEAAIGKARELGFKEVLLSGGSTLNGSFMKKGLIDKIIFDIEPVAVRSGISVFSKADMLTRRLKLIRIRKLEKGIVQLHYAVIS